MCESPELQYFLEGLQMTTGHRSPGSPSQCPKSVRRLAERCDPLRQPRDFARRRILVDHAAGNAAEQFRLRLLQRFGGLALVPGGDRGLDGLDEGPDAADARVVDDGPAIVPADALLGL